MAMDFEYLAHLFRSTFFFFSPVRFRPLPLPPSPSDDRDFSFRYISLRNSRFGSGNNEKEPRLSAGNGRGKSREAAAAAVRVVEFIGNPISPRVKFHFVARCGLFVSLRGSFDSVKTFSRVGSGYLKLAEYRVYSIRTIFR